MKVPNQYRVGQAIKYGITTNSPIARSLTHMESFDSEGNSGAFLIPKAGATSGFFFFVIASDQAGWDHVSITVIPEKRCPTWEEMCYVKALFWDDEETVMQLHPPKSDWINNHPYCLHLWRPNSTPETIIPLPPSYLVGVYL